MNGRRRSIEGTGTLARNRTRISPGLESLERRLVLSTTYTVTTLADLPTAGQTTLRQAIAAADADGNTNATSPDVINFAVTGAIALNSVLPAITGALAIEGPGASSLTLGLASTATNVSVATLSVAAGADTSVSGLTITGPDAEAILLGSGSSLAAQGVTFEHFGLAANDMTPPAGILGNQGGGSISVEGCTFTNGFATSIYDIGFKSLTVAGSTFSGNDGPGEGGAIEVAAGATGQGGGFSIADSLFSNNFAFNAGAIALSNGASGSIVDSTFTANQSNGYGGAIALKQFGPDFQLTSSLTLADSTVVGNTSGGSGLTVPNSGGGVYADPGDHLVLVDTIVAQNSRNGTTDDVDASVDPTSAFNLIGDGNGLTGAINGSSGNLVGTDASPINPMLGPLQNNSGPTLTMAPLTSSLAVDRGGPSPTTDAANPTDQRGLPRVVDQASVLDPIGGDGRDIGAVELQGPIVPTVLTVNTTADANPPTGTLSLRQAIEAADGLILLTTLPSSQIRQGDPNVFVIDLAVTGTIAIGSALPTLAAPGEVDLDGPGASSLTILGDGQAGLPVLQVGQFDRTSVANLTIDGDEGSGAVGILVGAGAIVSTASDIFQHIILPTGQGINGGIVALAGGSSVAVEQCTFTNLLVNGVVNEGGTLSVDESSFVNDLGATLPGGGVFSSALPSGAGGPVSITRSLFENNTSSTRGGAVALFGGSVATIADSTFSGNFASIGGGIDVQTAVPGGLTAATSVSVLRSTITGNGVVGGSSGGGLFASQVAVTVVDSIITGNTDNNGTEDDVAAMFTSASSNDLLGVGTGATGLTNGQNGIRFGDAANPLNPMLGPLQNNGGPTPTFAPLPGSPALDAGSGTSDPGTDQRGVVRGQVIDIGAYQATASTLRVFYPSPGTAGQGQAFAVEAVDSLGQLSYDDRDTLTFTSTDPNALIPSGTLTNGFGGFVATFKTAGLQSLTATDASTGLSGTQSGILIQAGPATSGKATSGTPQSAVVGTAFATPLGVEVLDSLGNPVAGVSVTFTVLPGSEASATFGGGSTTVTVATNAQGIASATGLVAGSVAGSFNVSASTNEGTLPLATFNLTASAASVITVASTATLQALQADTTGLVTLATFADPNLASFPIAGYSATINWGDGSGPLPATVEVVNGQLAVLGSHSFLSVGTFTPVVTLTHGLTGRSATADASIAVKPDITSTLSIRHGGLLYNFATGLYTAQLTITNSGRAPLVGPIELVVAGLPSTITLTNAAGTTGGGQPDVMISLASPIAVGGSIVVPLVFKDPARLLFDYTLRAYSLS